MDSIDIKKLRLLIQKSVNRSDIEKGKEKLFKKLDSIFKVNVNKPRSIKWIKG